MARTSGYVVANGPGRREGSAEDLPSSGPPLGSWWRGFPRALLVAAALGAVSLLGTVSVSAFDADGLETLLGRLPVEAAGAVLAVLAVVGVVVAVRQAARTRRELASSSGTLDEQAKRQTSELLETMNKTQAFVTRLHYETETKRRTLAQLEQEIERHERLRDLTQRMTPEQLEALTSWFEAMLAAKLQEASRTSVQQGIAFAILGAALGSVIQMLLG